MAYKIHVLLCCVTCVLVSSLTTIAQQETKRWYKGNLHTHTYWSDGDEYPEMVLDWYKSHGYDFIALSDHNTMAREEKWVKVIKSGSYETAFKKYVDKFGKDWVVYKTDSGRTLVKLRTYSEYKTKMADKNFLIIPAEEITDKFQGKHIHLGGINLQTVIPPQGGGSIVETMQRNIDAVLKQRKETGVPMFPHINHPNFFYSVTVQDMSDLTGERFFEVYNGHPLVHNEGDSTHPGTEQMWDMINIAYLRKHQPLLLGLASDDSHSYHEFGPSFANAGRGWLMVYAHALDPNTLINAMENGDFYASTGVTLSKLTFLKNELSVEIQSEAGVNYTIEFFGAVNGADKSTVLQRISGTEGKFRLTARHEFVRARITSDKEKPNPYRAGEFEMAWTQPVVFK